MIGVQEPRVWSVPASESSVGLEMVELAASAGLILDPWQQFVLEHGSGVREDGKWAAFEVAVDVARQNGKGGILEARELGALYLLGERLVIHSAHEFRTSIEAFLRLELLIDGCADLSRRVKRIVRSHGEEGITLTNGQRIHFRTRTKGGGRGLSCDTLILDEAMILPDKMIGALLPTLSARPNPQVWYTGSAVDQTIHEYGVVFARLRERGHAEEADPSLAYFEWSVDARKSDGKEVGPDQVDDEVRMSPEAWAQANPGLGIRISLEHVENELRSMAERTFAVERLGVGDWPETAVGGSAIIDLELWAALAGESEIVGQPVFAFDVTPDRSMASICKSGRREDGRLHLEVVEHKRGTAWLVPRLTQLNAECSPSSIVSSGSAITGTLVHELDVAGAPVTPLTAVEYAQACVSLVDAVKEATMSHSGASAFRDAIKGAARRPLEDAWAWSRKTSSVDISPLVAGTLALWGASTAPTGEYVVDVAALMAS
jgi:hypothetical protein